MTGVSERVRELIDQLDPDHPGEVNYHAFLAGAVDQKKWLTKNNLEFAFHHFDTTSSGTIKEEDLIEVFHREGKSITTEEVHKMLEEADISHTGEITFEDFTKLMNSVL